jgi:hypothetical protein
MVGEGASLVRSSCRGSAPYTPRLLRPGLGVRRDGAAVRFWPRDGTSPVDSLIRGRPVHINLAPWPGSAICQWTFYESTSYEVACTPLLRG